DEVALGRDPGAPLVAEVELVEDADGLALIEKLPHRDAADVARPARDQYHRAIDPLSGVPLYQGSTKLWNRRTVNVGRPEPHPRRQHLRGADLPRRARRSAAVVDRVEPRGAGHPARVQAGDPDLLAARRDAGSSLPAGPADGQTRALHHRRHPGYRRRRASRIPDPR